MISRLVLIRFYLLSTICFVLFILSPLSSSAFPILADTLFIKAMGLTPKQSDPSTQLSVVDVTESQAESLAHSAHRFGKCGGFERLKDTTDIQNLFENFQVLNSQTRSYLFLSRPSPLVERQSSIENAIKNIDIENLKTTVQWLSQFQTRFHKGKDRNVPQEELARKIEVFFNGSDLPHTIEFIKHIDTPQSSLHVRLIGSSRPQEIIVLGGHIDSIANWGHGAAPGADDNASGSANILEVLRVMTKQAQPQRTVDFFWYAGEEEGLLGSSEIATTYKENGADVVGVMQLDMTLFPGEGELVFGDMTDFTNPWLRDYMKDLSHLYVGAQWREDQCGYGCSDHATWYRQGYPTVMPFEATMNTMNDLIHSTKDTVSPRLNFKHSEALAKLALAFVMDLSNSELRATF